MVIANEDYSDRHYLGQVGRAIIQPRQGLFCGLENEAVAAMQFQRVLTEPIASQRMKVTGQFPGKVEIADSRKIVESDPKLPSGLTPQCARGEGIVMAQLPELFRLE